MSLIFKNLSLEELKMLSSKCRECERVRDLTSKLEGNTVAKLMEVDEKMVGLGFCLPQTSLGRRRKSLDVALLSCLHIYEEFRGLGFGKILLQRLERELISVDFKAVEAVGSTRKNSGIPLDFLLGNGFYIKKKNPVHPIVRLDLVNIVREADPEKVFYNFPLLPKPAIDKVLLEKI